MQRSRIGRRGFLTAAAGAAAASTVMSSSQSMAKEPELHVEYGEPYELAGKRLLFLNWWYIRTGSFAWTDKSGQRVSLTSAVRPAEARILRTDSPHGIQLIAQ